MISTKGRYALRVMIDLAEHQTDGYIPLKEIASRQNISEKYLESIIKSLVKSNMLVGLRGKGGGYRLTREPDQYTIGEVRSHPSLASRRTPSRAPVCLIAARFHYGEGSMRS